MTDRQIFENRAIECGATILESTDTMLKVLATNGTMITIYQFNESGEFTGIAHHHKNF